MLPSPEESAEEELPRTPTSRRGSVLLARTPRLTETLPIMSRDPRPGRLFFLSAAERGRPRPLHLSSASIRRLSRPRPSEGVPSWVEGRWPVSRPAPRRFRGDCRRSRPRVRPTSASPVLPEQATARALSATRRVVQSEIPGCDSAGAPSSVPSASGRHNRTGPRVRFRPTGSSSLTPRSPDDPDHEARCVRVLSRAPLPNDPLRLPIATPGRAQPVGR